MKPSRRKTLDFKKTPCQICKHADKRALRKGWNYCNITPTIRNGHCLQFDSMKPKHNKGNNDANQENS